MIRVLLAEDHAVVRAGLEELLEGSDDIEVVGSAADGPDAVALVAELQPTVVLCDLSMPGFDGIEATSRILEQSPETRVVILTAFSDPDRIRGALDAGAVGYLLKDADPEELFGAVRAAARGESPLAPKAASVVLADRAERHSVELTPRERDVLGLLASGLPNKRIALRLEISEKTVKAHLTRVFERIGVTDRTQAALWAQRNGISAEPDGIEPGGANQV
jgi:DNA-binding NarL/FixJ family response regulator